MRKHLVLTLFILTGGLRVVQAQIETTAYFMNSLPQSVIGNPAFVPTYKFSLTLPGTSVMAGYSNSGFSYNDLIKKENGKVTADLSKWIRTLPDKSNVTGSAQVDLLRLGVRINPRLYVTLSSTAKAYSLTLIPKDMAALFVDGTSLYVGKSVSTSPEAQLTSYLENALGFSYEVTKQLRIGARLKLLNGGVSINTKTSNLNVVVADSYNITAAADVRVKTSGLYDINQSGYSFSDEVGNYFKNTGWGIDLGATYKLTDKITLAASLIDIGQINWKNNTYEYSLDKATANYTFSGIDAKELFNGNSKPLDAQIDSIKEKFDWKEKQIGSFKTPLPSKMYLSGSYHITKSFTAGAILFAEKYHGRFGPGFALAMNKHFGKILSTSLSYTLSNRSFTNFGAGLSLNLAPVQIYLVGDNLLNMPILLATRGELNPYINSTQVFTLRAGINFVWGRTKDSDERGTSSKSFNSKKKKSTKQSTPDVIKIRKKRK